MRYLLDVNLLIALSFERHQFHERATQWALGEQGSALLTCSITELGCIRILANTPEYGLSLEQARTILLRLKSNQRLRLEILADNNDISRLPAWVQTPKQTTDGHLLELAKTHKAVLATLDAKIPGAFLIP